MKGLLIVAAICAVYSLQTWKQDIGPLYIKTQNGTVPQKYYPLTRNDKRATHRARLIIGYIKKARQINPLKLPSLGPYNIVLSDENFQGDLHLSNIVVNGLKRLSLSGLEMRIEAPSRVDFNVRFSRVSSEANFQLQGFHINETLNVYGQLSATLRNLALSAAVGTKLTELESKQVYQVDSADIHINLKKLQLSMNMNQYAEDFKETVLRFLYNTPHYSSIVDDVLRAVLKAINHELTLITDREILQYLLS